MIRIVIDPNIIASVLLGGLTRGRYRWLLDNLARFEICYSDLLTDEIERFGNAPYFQQKGVSKEEIRSFLNTFQSFSIKILVTSKVRQGRDRNDFYLLSLCRDSKARFLITGDPDLLEIGQYAGVEIISMKEFVERFK